jgi:hypothetical protein
MKLKFILTITFLVTTLFLSAQTSGLIVNPNIALLSDSIESKQLLSSLNDFLVAAQKPNEENKFILPSEKIETYVLLDEINGIAKSGRFKNDFFYKPYLTNVVPLKESKYLIQVSYIGVDEKTPLTRASFKFIATKTNNTFLFSSTLIRNSRNWKVLKVGNNIFHYQSDINKAKTKEYDKMASVFDGKLKSKDKITEFYCTENFAEVLNLIGVDYKSDYNGYTENTLSSSLGDRKVIVLGNNNANFNDFDPHDLWHDRLSLVISRRKVNKPIDEACAYLYGGSWGISWKDIFKQFETKIASDKNSNWSDYKENPVNFGESQARHLMVDYVVNALIVQKIEKEKGFDGVWEFLNCGPYEKGNENYYKTLEKLTGITRNNYNDKVWELIKNEK